MAFDYTNLSASLARALALSGVAGRDQIISDLLEDSAATLNGSSYYRPFYGAAITIWQNRGDQTIASADGAKFRGDEIGLEPIIRSLLMQQQALDTAYGWEVPPGFDVGAAIGNLCGCQSEPAAVASSVMAIMVG